MKKKVGIVILNYNNYQETMNCVQSIQTVIKSCYPIVIVDNGSVNESSDVLIHKYHGDSQVRVLCSEKNLGFARGNNLGISYIRNKVKCDFVLLLNSDILMADPLYIEKMLAEYAGGVGVIEANVWDRKGIFAQPTMYRPSVRSAVHLWGKAVCKYYHIFYPFCYLDQRCEEYICQVGCAIMLTPAYFQFYEGLYSKTFLYGEEHILLLLLKRAGLQLGYSDDTYVIHNEGGSTDMESLEGSRKKEKKVLKGYFNLLCASVCSTKKLRKLAR